MRKTTKILFGSAAVLATAALVQIATPATAGATAIADSNITVNAATQTVTIKKDVLGDGNNRQIYFGIPKVSKNKEVTAPTKWDVYDTVGSSSSDDLVISLASLKNTADNYIQIKGSKDADPVTILIPKAEKYRAEFNPVAEGSPTDKFFKVTKAKKVNGEYPAFEGSKVEIRTQHGNWSEFTLGDTNPFAAYQEQGATIYMRVPAASTASFEPATGYIMKKKKATDTPVTVDVKKAASFASAEFKVSVKKRADGPKVSVDFVKGTLSVPAKCLYRVVNVAELGTGTFIGADAADTSKASAKKETVNLADTVGTFMIEQKQAADATKKKMESKVAQLKVTRPGNPEIVDATISESSNSCVDGKVNREVSISISDDKKKLNFENESDKVYQVYLKKNDVDVTSDKAVWKDIKAKKVTTTATKNGTYSIKLPDEDTQIWIRVKGDAKTATLSSNALSLGKVKYDKAAADAGTADKKIDEAVGKLKEAGSVAGTSKSVTVASDKKSLKLPSAPTGVTYGWASDKNTIIGDDGKLKSDIAADAISEESGTATVTLTATVKATGTETTKKVKFEVTVKKTTSSEGESATSTYTIESVAQGTDATA